MTTRNESSSMPAAKRPEAPEPAEPTPSPRPEAASNKPLVSVIIPAYNCGDCLARALDSVMKQSHSPIECIVVDDGSTDDTAAVARSFGSKVKLIGQANGGASAARNRGIEKASGELIAFLDADDYWHPSKLEKQVRLLQEQPDVVLVSTGFRTYLPGQSSEPGAESSMEPYSPDICEIHADFLTLFRDPYLGTPSVMVRTQRAREVGGFDTTLPVAEDVDFYFRVCSGHSYARIEQALTIIHQRSGSLTRTLPGYQYNLEVIDKVAQRNPEFAQLHADEFAKQRLLIYSRWIEKSLYAGRGREARRLLRESRTHGSLDDGLQLALKSFCAWPLAVMRRWLPKPRPPSGKPTQAGN